MAHSTLEHRRAFNALLAGQFSNFALINCMVNGEPVSAIAAITEIDGEIQYVPVFVGVTPNMQLCDHLRGAA